MISQESVESFLQRLASDAPTPGGAPTAALYAAQGAALASMAARFTSGEQYRDVEEEAASIAERARRCIETALHAAQRDEHLFGELTDTYKMPDGNAAEQAERSAAIQRATIAATSTQLAIIEVAAEVVTLARRLLEICNSTVTSDVGGAAEGARAGAATALFTLELNINTITDAGVRERLTATARRAEQTIAAAQDISRRAREVITG